MNWKLFSIITVISIIITISLYIKIDVINSLYSKLNTQTIQKEEGIANKIVLGNETKKIPYENLTREEFDDIIIPEDMVLYYFPEECPDFTKGIYISIIVNDLEKYYIPENNNFLLVKKEHKWTKDPNFVLWRKPLLE